MSGEDGEPMVITDDGQTMVLDGSQTVIDEQTGQLMVSNHSTAGYTARWRDEFPGRDGYARTLSL